MHWKKSVVNRSGFQAVAQFALGRDAALRFPARIRRAELPTAAIIELALRR